MADYKTAPLRFYIRLSASQAAEARQEIDRLFGEVEYLARSRQPEDELALVTGEMTEYQLEEKLSQLKSGTLRSMIRVLDY